MSDTALAEREAFRELDSVVRHLAEELAAFRRRALKAEARLRELEGRDAGEPGRESTTERVAELEQENAALIARLDRATVRARQMMERVRFLRQQARNGAAT